MIPKAGSLKRKKIKSLARLPKKEREYTND